MKYKCLVYGNCQSRSINHFLARHPDFSKQYEIIDIKPVHLLSSADIPNLEELISTVDLFIHQPIADNYKGIPQLSTKYLLSKLKDTSQSISFPVAYFTGYHPEITYLKDGSGKAIDRPFSYHDLNILKLYSENKTIDETIDLINSDTFYSDRYLEDNLKQTLSKLEQREFNLDIKLTPFIKANFKRQRLFNTFNHPNYIVIGFIIDFILELTNISSQQTFADLFQNKDTLSQSSLPIYPSVIKSLGLSFESEKTYYLDKQLFSQREVIEIFYKFYQINQDKIREYLTNTLPRT